VEPSWSRGRDRAERSRRRGRDRDLARVWPIESIQAHPGPKPEAFRVDHPFAFFIVDEVIGAILFAGRVSDPRVALASN